MVIIQKVAGMDIAWKWVFRQKFLQGLQFKHYLKGRVSPHKEDWKQMPILCSSCQNISSLQKPPTRTTIPQYQLQRGFFGL